MKKRILPQIKICGLTAVDAAETCAELGADAIGLVFYPKSPRFVTDDIARRISRSVTHKAKTVGVFVNNTYDEIMKKVEFCSLSAVQLHGRESPNLVGQLRKEKIRVIKALFLRGIPSLCDIEQYEAWAYLVEYAPGSLPGGNAMVWPWQQASLAGRNYPLILAGGLDSKNVADAVYGTFPDAVDVSSGVEASPGIKDPEKVAAFISRVKTCTAGLPPGQYVKTVF